MATFTLCELEMNFTENVNLITAHLLQAHVKQLKEDLFNF